jgi:hypothetical protein
MFMSIVVIGNAYAAQMDNTNSSTNMQAITTQLYQLLTVGTGAAAFITWFANLQLKKREAEIEMSNRKIDSISVSLSSYTKLITNSRAFSDVLNKELQNQLPEAEQGFYFLCNFLNKYRKIYDSGSIRLGSLLAEEILASLYDRLTDELEGEEIKYDDLQFMRDLSQPYFGKFKNDITTVTGKANYLYRLFKDWLHNTENEKLRETMLGSLLFAKSLEFEINVIYHRWYERYPDFNFQDKSTGINLEDFVKTKYCKYFNRIRWFKSNRLIRLFLKREN